MRTGFSKGFANSKPKSPDFLMLEPETVSQLVIRAIAGKKFEVVMPWSLALITRVARMAPGLFRAGALRAFRSYVIARKKAAA